MAQTKTMLSGCLLGAVALWAGPARSADAGVPLSHFDIDVADKQLDPCADFYQYACSKWMAANPIPADEVAWFTGSNLQVWNETVLRETMEQFAEPDPKRTHLQQQLGDYWAVCMDEAKLDRDGVAPIKGALDRIARMRSKTELAAEIAKLHQNIRGATGGFGQYDNATPAALFGYGPTQDFADAALVVGAIDQGGMGLPGRDYYLGDDVKAKEIRQKYLAHIARLFVLAGEKPAQAETDAASVMRIEAALARASMDVVARRDPKNINNVRTLAQVKAATPSFSWATYFKAVGAPEPKHYIVATPGFLAEVETLLRTEPLAAWKAYLRWWTLHGSASSLSQPFVDANFDFFARTLLGAQQPKPRWERCVGYADRDLGEALGAAYIERAFPGESKSRSLALVKAIEHALAGDIEQLDWMSTETKTAAKAKLAAIEEKIAYPKSWRDYGPLSIGRESLIANAQAASAFELRRQLAKIGKPVDRAEWTMTPPTIDAYYDPQLNTINFPAGILQPPYFEAKQDDAANFGAIGMVIGHEIVHGFDDQGRKFDGQGNLRDWWTVEDGQSYDSRGKCIVDEYSQQIPELGVKQDGRLTQGEDTADNGGLHIALLALENTLKAQGKSLDDLGPGGISFRQEFFLSYGFSWCANVRPETARVQVVTNPHSLPKLRVNNVVANMPEFQKAFGCKKGSAMVHEVACRVW